MRYEREGDGPVLLLLPALGCDHRLWRPVGERLRDRFTVIYPEISNQGSLHAAARGVRDIIVEEGAAGAALAGLSMGGYVVFECLRHWPEKVRAAALFGASPFPRSQEEVDALHDTAEEIRSGRFEDVVQALSAMELAPAAAGDSDLADLLKTMARETGAAAVLADLEAIAKKGSYTDVLPLIRVPVLLACGGLDALAPPDLVRRASADVPGSSLEVISGAGHLPPLENPDRTAEVLSAFLEKALHPALW